MNRKVNLEKLAELAIEEAVDYGLEILLLGEIEAIEAFTKELRKHAPERMIWHCTPGGYDKCLPMKLGKSCVIILDNNIVYASFPFPDRSLVIDPFDIVPFNHGISVMGADGC